MKSLLLVLAMLFTFSTSANAQFLNTYQWKSRLVLIFTPAPDDPLFERQMRLLAERREDFEERDVIFIAMTPEGNHENTGFFLDESLSRQYYEHFSPYQYQFEMILVGLDGTEKFRATNTVTPSSILLELIDGMPMRQREVLKGYGNKSMISGQQNDRQINKRRKH